MIKKIYIFGIVVLALLSCEPDPPEILFGPSTIISPRDSVVVNSFPIRFEWKVYNEAISQVSTVRLFESTEDGKLGKLIRTKEIQKQSYFVLDTFDFGVTYYWDIVSRNQQGLVFNTDKEPFRTANYRPTSVEITTPTEDLIIAPTKDYIENGYRVNWLDKNKTNQSLLQEIILIKKSSFYSPKVDTTKFTTNQSYIDLTNLTYGVPYSLYIKTYNQIDPLRFARSLPVNFKVRDTLGSFRATYPAKDTLLEAKIGATAEWTVPKSTSPNKTLYNIYFKTIDKQTSKVLVDDSLNAVSTAKIDISNYIRFSGVTQWWVKAYNDEQNDVFVMSDTSKLTLVSREFFETSVLGQIYKEMDGDNWNNKCAGWNIPQSSPASYYGISYNEKGHKITGIDLSDCGLTGKLSDKFKLLVGLETLDISQNSGLCELPNSMPGSLTNFVMRSNQCTGRLPAEAGGYAGLNNLSFNGNQYDGQVPAAFGSLVNLKVLDLRDNPLLRGYVDAFVCDNVAKNSLNVLIKGTKLISCEDRDK